MEQGAESPMVKFKVACIGKRETRSRKSYSEGKVACIGKRDKRVYH